MALRSFSGNIKYLSVAFEDLCCAWCGVCKERERGREHCTVLLFGCVIISKASFIYSQSVMPLDVRKDSSLVMSKLSIPILKCCQISSDANWCAHLSLLKAKAECRIMGCAVLMFMYTEITRSYCDCTTCIYVNGVCVCMCIEWQTQAHFD